MNSEFLQAANVYKNKQEYKKAVDCYEAYCREQVAPYEEALYKDYAKCLRLSGETRRAKEVLEEGRGWYPENIAILKESCTVYEVSGDFKAAKVYAETLIHLEPEQSSSYIRLGSIYAQLKETAKVETAYQKALTYQHGMDLDALMYLVRNRVVNNPDQTSSHYVHMGGMNNLGAFIHEHAEGKYMTKIARYKGSNRREAFFYQEISTAFPILQEVVPAYIDSFVKDQILYLTIELKAGEFAVLEQFPEALAIHEKIASISYKEAADFFNIPSYRFQFNLRNPNIVTQFFTHIHEEAYNRQLFKSLRMLVSQREIPDTVDFLVNRLEALVMDNQLYVLVEPERHYTLLHGEYKPGTIIIEASTNKGYVIDWSTFTIGPPCVEIARYLSASLPVYQTVQQLYLHQAKQIDQLTFVERILFLYAIVLFYILRFIKSQNTDTREKIEQFITEALDEMARLIEAHRLFIDDRLQIIRLQQQLHTSKQQISSLQKDKKHLKKQLKHTFNSKSWKITAPFRKISERLRQ